jgi:diguanylate cyclase (GGDEF)-like protein
MEDASGSIWVGTSQGLSQIKDPVAVFLQRPLEPVISSIQIGDRAYETGGVAYSKQPFDIQLGTMNFASDEVVRFRYRLSGVDEAWDETETGTIRYAFLPPGRHVLTVVSYNQHTHQVSVPLSVVVEMAEPWWLSLPLLLSYGIGFVLILYGGMRLRTRVLVAQRLALQKEVAAQTREIRAGQEALKLLAIQDGLTKLLTRGEIERRLTSTLAAHPGPGLMTIGLFDIDHFKRVNDVYGHLVGDEILQQLAERIRESLLEGEYAGRYGGEELLIVTNSKAETGLRRMHAINQAACGAPFLVDGHEFAVTCSVGVAQTNGTDDWKSFVGRADKALYQAKREGRNRVVTTISQVS